MVISLEEKQKTKTSGGILNIKRHGQSRPGILVFWGGHKPLIVAVFLSTLLHFMLVLLTFEPSDTSKKTSGGFLGVKPLIVQLHANPPAAEFTPNKLDTAVPATLSQTKTLKALEINPYPKMGAEKEVGTVYSEPAFAVEITPKFPLPLLAKGTRGSVSAIFKVERSGAIFDIEITDSQPSGVFDSAAIAAISSARMKEGSVRQGQRMGVTIIFDPAGIQSSQQQVPYLK